MRVYFDSVTMIYFVERVSPWFAAIHARLSTGTVDIAFSDLTRMECRVKPLTTGDAALLQSYEAAFGAAECVPMPRAVFDRAAELRAGFPTKLKTPDALHLAAAIEAGCDLFLTNDAALLACTDIRVELI